MTPHEADILIVGAGAAGLMAAIHAGRAAPRGTRIVVLDGARTLGAKILVAGGGRCNVTHHVVDERQYAGSTTPAIRQVLRQFSVEETVEFFRDLGVTLKREATGKLFPTTDRARTVLDALLAAVRAAHVEIVHPARMIALDVDGDALHVTTESAERGSESWRAAQVILATGGRALPKSGSDGTGLRLVSALGHTVTPLFPALVPLRLDDAHPFRALSGITLRATVTVVSGTGKRGTSFTNDLLFTHFGLSGPAVMDISRYLTDARRHDPDAGLRLNVLPDQSRDALDAELRALGRGTVRSALRDALPQRLVDAVLDLAAVAPDTTGATLTRDQRRTVLTALFDHELPVIGDRGYTHAEVTAGGVPLKEIELRTMRSRRVPGLFLCGEICDVDGRIGGFNFQWAWASGASAGRAAAAACLREEVAP